MTNLNGYLQDGACTASRIVLMMLQDFNISSSYDYERGKYKAEIKVARWENCREQGYVIMLHNTNYKQINIAFFEHRNSDSICAVKWLQNTINTPTIDTAKFGDVYKTKHDTSFKVNYNEWDKMADWIKTQLNLHWENEKED